MPAIVCLIADPATGRLDPPLVREVTGLVKGEPRWLAPEAVVELAAAGDPDPTWRQLRPFLAGTGIDWAVLPPSPRRRRLLLSDMDSTMITVECIDELADLAGIKPAIAEVTRRAMNGEIDFPSALRQRVALLEGLPVTAIEEVLRERVRLMPGARTLLRTMRANGAYAVLVSGGFTEFTDKVMAQVGFDAQEANRLEIVDGKLTGRLIDPLHDASSKRNCLLRVAEARGIPLAETMAVGDGANDLPMLEAAGLGVAFRAHPNVQAAAPVIIQRADLTALLYLQGYTKDEFLLA